jgi:hypothetical protein
MGCRACLAIYPFICTSTILSTSRLPLQQLSRILSHPSAAMSASTLLQRAQDDITQLGAFLAHAKSYPLSQTNRESSCVRRCVRIMLSVIGVICGSPMNVRRAEDLQEAEARLSRMLTLAMNHSSNSLISTNSPRVWEELSTRAEAPATAFRTDTSRVSVLQ